MTLNASLTPHSKSSTPTPHDQPPGNRPPRDLRPVITAGRTQVPSPKAKGGNVSATAEYWQYGERVEKTFPNGDAAHDHMTDLWAEGECSPVEVIDENGEHKEPTTPTTRKPRTPRPAHE